MKKVIFAVLVMLSSLSFSQEEKNEVIKDSVPHDETVSYAIIEKVPVFPGCTDGDNYALKMCFNKKMRMHIAKNFNAGDMKCKRYEKKLNEKTGIEEKVCVEELPPGRNRIVAKFRINKKGGVDTIEIEAPSERLKEEVQRVLKILPNFEPGTQRGKTVNVKYYLPIQFNLH